LDSAYRVEPQRSRLLVFKIKLKAAVVTFHIPITTIGFILNIVAFAFRAMTWVYHFLTIFSAARGDTTITAYAPTPLRQCDTSGESSPIRFRTVTALCEVCERAHKRNILHHNLLEAILLVRLKRTKDQIDGCTTGF